MDYRRLTRELIAEIREYGAALENASAVSGQHRYTAMNRRLENRRLRAQVAELEKAGDRMRWAYRHETADLPTTGTRTWAEWNAAVQVWNEAKGTGEERWIP